MQWPILRADTQEIRKKARQKGGTAGPCLGQRVARYPGRLILARSRRLFHKESGSPLSSISRGRTARIKKPGRRPFDRAILRPLARFDFPSTHPRAPGSRRSGLGRLPERKRGVSFRLNNSLPISAHRPDPNIYTTVSGPGDECVAASRNRGGGGAMTDATARLA
jgi:hypothetical protein